MKTLVPRFSSDTFHFEQWIRLRDFNTIVQDGWCYSYDMYDAPSYPIDMAVPPEWIGKRAKDCVGAPEFCLLPHPASNEIGHQLKVIKIAEAVIDNAKDRIRELTGRQS